MQNDGRLFGSPIYESTTDFNGQPPPASHHYKHHHQQQRQQQEYPRWWWSTTYIADDALVSGWLCGIIKCEYFTAFQRLNSDGGWSSCYASSSSSESLFSSSSAFIWASVHKLSNMFAPFSRENQPGTAQSGAFVRDTIYVLRCWTVWGGGGAGFRTEKCRYEEAMGLHTSLRTHMHRYLFDLQTQFAYIMPSSGRITLCRCYLARAERCYLMRCDS